jgi:hypothetical protein
MMLFCAKNRLGGFIKKLRRLPLIFFILILPAFFLVSEGDDQSVYGAGFKSYFRGGTSTIHAFKMADYSDYKYWSDHEWGHYLFEYKLRSSDFKSWIKIVNNCTFESSYALTYHSRGLRLEEEFAESFASVMNNKTICQDKIDFVRRFS